MYLTTINVQGQLHQVSLDVAAAAAAANANSKFPPKLSQVTNNLRRNSHTHFCCKRRGHAWAHFPINHCKAKSCY